MNLGAPEIITILVVALLIFGPKKLPELGRSLGHGIREFRKGTQGLKDELEMSFKEEVAPPAAAQPITAQPVTLQPGQTTVISADTSSQVPSSQTPISQVPSSKPPQA